MSNLLAMDYKDRVKQWLDDRGKNREWLASKCNVALQTVNNWLSTGRPVPAKAKIIIDGLMAATDSDAETEQNLVLRVGYEKFDAYNRAASKNGMLIREWLIHAADQAAKEDRKERYAPLNIVSPEEFKASGIPLLADLPASAHVGEPPRPVWIPPAIRQRHGQRDNPVAGRPHCPLTVTAIVKRQRGGDQASPADLDAGAGWPAGYKGTSSLAGGLCADL